MRLYIAASSHPGERARVDRAFDAALAIPGGEIVGDWRQSVDEHGANPGGIVARLASLDCLRGIDNCDVVWFLIPLTESRGCWVEIGYAWGRGKRIVASGHTPSQSVFTTLADYLCGSDEAAVDALRALAVIREVANA